MESVKMLILDFDELGVKIEALLDERARVLNLLRAALVDGVVLDARARLDLERIGLRGGAL